MAHGPTEYNERSPLLRNERVDEDDGRRDQGPPPPYPRATNPEREPKELKDLTWSDIFAGLFGLLILAALACGVIFTCGLVIIGISRLVSHINWSWPHPGKPEPHPGKPEPPYVRKIAIIGAGPAGSSAAYNIRNFAQQKGISVNITIYEKNDYIGGRSTCKVWIDDDQPIQIAARGFHASDKNLVDTVKGLGLSPVMLDGKDDTDLTGRSGERWGVFDGSNFVYRQAHPSNILSSWWLAVKLFYFYGYSPRYTNSLVAKTASKLRQIYTPRFFPFTSLTLTIKNLELEEETSSTGRQILSDAGVSTLFQKDLVTAWTRRDFGQNLGQISGLAMSMTPDDGEDMTVKGGHWTLFEEMVRSSKADILLKTTAFGLRKMDWGGWVVAAEDNTEDDDLNYQEFDTVILATPYQLAGLEIKGDRLQYVPDELEYAAVHVTLFKSQRKLSPDYFRLKGEVPETILTTLGNDEFEGLSGRTGTEGVGRVGFYSVTSVKRLARLIQGVIVEEFLYKLVSPGRIEEGFLNEMLGASEEERGVISWIYRHEFPDAYPYIYPRKTFTDSVLDENFWYTSGIEELGSSLEMSSMMGSNVAKLVVNGWVREGKKGKRPPPPEEQPQSDEDGEKVPKMSLGTYLKEKYEGVI